MTKTGITELCTDVQLAIDAKNWSHALELAEELVGALKVKSCLGSGD